MVTHYFILRALAQELNSYLRGVSLGEIFTQKKNELIISVHREGSDTAEHSVSISVDPKLNYCFMREGVSRAKKNSVDLFRDIAGLTIERVSVHPSDRIIQFEMSNSWKLCAQLYNTIASNIVLVDEKGVIRDAFKNRKELNGTNLPEAKLRFDPGVLKSDTLFRESLATDTSKTIFQSLKQTVSLLGSTYAREVLHRAKVDEKIAVNKIDNDECEHIRQETQTLLSETDWSNPVLYYRGDEAKVLSVIHLQPLAGSKSESFTNMNEAIRSSIAKSFRSHGIESDKKIILDRIKGELERTRRSLDAIREHASESSRAEEYEHTGNVIMANLQHLTKGTKQIDIPDVYTDGKNIRVILDPKLTPARNAERYFDKAKKAKSAREQSEEQAQSFQVKLSLLEKLLLHLDQCQASDQVKEFKREYHAQLLLMKLIPRAKGEEELPFRSFTVAGGFEVLVGKSSANNDLLTMRYAKPNDLWFHVRGAGGSHTVLRTSGNSSTPSRDAILQAASIAAYYSKMRNARNIPVAYCERKYVRKPKGLAEGAVTLEREKVVFVNPGLPE